MMMGLLKRRNIVSVAVTMGMAILLAGLEPTEAAMAATKHDTPSVIDQIDLDLAQGLLSTEQATLLKVRAILKPATLPDPYTTFSNASELCGTPVLLQAFQSRTELSKDGQAKLASLMARPAMPLFYDSPDGLYRIHYSLTGTDAVPAFDGDTNGVPDWIEDVAYYADSSWRHEVINMGYFAPPSDGSAGGSSHYDIYCGGLSAGGQAIPENPAPEAWNDYTSYILLHHNFYNAAPNTDPEGLVKGKQKTVVSHEIFHSIQFAYDVTDELWFYEASATWMTEEVFDEANSMYNSLPWYFNFPERTLSSLEFGHRYGALIWPQYLSEAYGDEIIHEIWTSIIGTSAPNAWEIALASRESSTGEAFKEFTCWNWMTNSRADTQYYEESVTYPAVAIMRTHSSYPVSASTSNNPPEALASNYIQFIPQGGLTSESIRLDFDGEDSVEWGARVVARRSGGEYEIYEVSLDSGGTGSHTLQGFADYAHAVLIPSVLSTESGANYTYSACLGPVAPNATAPLTGDSVSTPLTLDWATVPGGLSYRVQVDDDSTFGTPDYDAVLPGTEYEIDPPTGGLYYWRARATDDCSDGGWSDAHSFQTICGVALTGDVNEDGSLSAGDIIALVNYVFKAGDKPMPRSESGDVNCSGTVTSSDIIYMVSHVFKSAAAPCDVCTLL
jgi:hypothetical protein